MFWGCVHVKYYVLGSLVPINLRYGRPCRPVDGSSISKGAKCRLSEGVS